MGSSIIVVEGIDAAGKTTLAQGISREMGCLYVKSPASRTPDQRKVYDREGATVQDRFDFYLGASRDDIDTLGKMTTGGKIVVVDRLITSTIVHHRTMDPTINLRDAPNLDRNFQRIQILLRASRETILERLGGRPVRTRFEDDADLFMRTQEGFEASTNNLIIDTGIHGVDETLRIARNYIKQILSL